MSVSAHTVEIFDASGGLFRPSPKGRRHFGARVRHSRLVDVQSTSPFVSARTSKWLASRSCADTQQTLEQV